MGDSVYRFIGAAGGLGGATGEQQEPTGVRKNGVKMVSKSSVTWVCIFKVVYVKCLKTY
jgi:hypothetical protein